MRITIIVTIGYVCGSVPFAYLLTRVRGLDLRATGSRNLGAANVLRAAGAPRAIAVLMLDAAKGAIAVLVAMLLTDDMTVTMAAGLASIVGHIYPVWVRFRGGKGVATSAGVFAVIAPAATAIAVLVFIGTIYATRFVSAGSMAAALVLPVAAAAANAPQPVVSGAMLSAAVVAFRHRENVMRLLAGTERRIGLRL
jgi:glycerol-3-phosphate acyltransferase PlsY